MRNLGILSRGSISFKLVVSFASTFVLAALDISD